jgi:YVTN family beta-propeller protein
MRLLLGFLVIIAANHLAAEPPPLSPTALAATTDGKMIYVACATAGRVLGFDIRLQKVVAVYRVPPSPSGLALTPDNTRLLVTCTAPESRVCIIDLQRQKITGEIPVGHTAMAPVPSWDGKTLYVCNQFNHDISVVDLVAKKETARIEAGREPVAAALTKDGKYLLVANQLPSGRADVADVAADVSVIDLAAGKAVTEIRLPSGSGSLKDIQVSPDGKYAAVTHIFSRFDQSTTQVLGGWMNANALTLIDLAARSVRYSLLLDEPQQGAANPWGAAWTADGQTLVVAHAGTHEISLIDFPALLEAITAVAKPTHLPRSNTGILSFGMDYEGTRGRLPFLTGGRRRIRLAPGDLGPRAVVVVSNTVYTANYFSDTLSAVDWSVAKSQARSIALGPKPKMNLVRRGECYFHDATLCRGGWQSCSSCHPGGARADGFNWDLLNDGFGNPKNTRSLLLAHETPPAMSLGVRASAEVAVRAGIKFILFTNPPEAVATAMNEYLKALKPVPSPYLVHGKLSAAARRGQALFGECGCATCHLGGRYTDLHHHDVGTRGAHDQPTDQFYTPTLMEVWRTAPYLHDGSAATMREVLTTRNRQDMHGSTSSLTDREVDDLCEYVLSL